VKRRGGGFNVNISQAEVALCYLHTVGQYLSDRRPQSPGVTASPLFT